MKTKAFFVSIIALLTMTFASTGASVAQTATSSTTDSDSMRVKIEKAMKYSKENPEDWNDFRKEFIFNGVKERFFAHLEEEGKDSICLTLTFWGGDDFYFYYNHWGKPIGWKSKYYLTVNPFAERVYPMEVFIFTNGINKEIMANCQISVLNEVCDFFAKKEDINQKKILAEKEKEESKKKKREEERQNDIQKVTLFFQAAFTPAGKDPYELAREIMGRDFISPQEVMGNRSGVVYTEGQLKKFAEAIPSKELFMWCHENQYLLIPGPNRRMDLSDVCDLNLTFFEEGRKWYNQKIAKTDRAETRWYMIRKGSVENSENKNWKEQQGLIDDGDIVIPNVTEVAWAITTYKSVRDVYLFNKDYVRTSSIGLGGCRIIIGGFDCNGLSVENCWNYRRYSNLGVAIRK